MMSSVKPSACAQFSSFKAVGMRRPVSQLWIVSQATPIRSAT